MADRTLTDSDTVKWDFGAAGEAKPTVTQADNPGVAGQVLTSQGPGSLPDYEDPAAAGGGEIDFQRFNASGTWNKPDGDQFGEDSRVLIRAWGAGGGGSDGGSAGGGGGAFVEKWMRLDDLGATESVSIGAGGTPGNDGGDTTFGTELTAYGGNGAGFTGAGDGAGPLGSDSEPRIITDESDGRYFGEGGTSSEDAQPGIDHGGGGAGDDRDGGNSIRGGGGGGGSNASGGTSVEGGNGGDDGQDGQQPGGGGGANNGSGADGRVDVYVFPVAD